MGKSADSMHGLDQGRIVGRMAAAMLLLLLGFTLALTLPAFWDKAGTPFWFVGMLVIFGAALAMIAMVFHSLGLSSRDEAFGLPAGSVRSLLAVGVMVLFAVFGLQALLGDGAASSPGWQPFSTATVADAAQANSEIERYERMGLLAIAGTATAATGVELRIYSPTRTTPQGAQDTQRQVITALITLVTSVVSFYFGSRSVEAMAKGMGESRGGNLLDAINEELKRLDDGVAKAEARLTAMRGTRQFEPGKDLAKLDDQLARLKTERGSLDILLKDAARGSVTAELVSQRLQALRVQLAMLELGL